MSAQSARQSVVGARLKVVGTLLPVFFLVAVGIADVALESNPAWTTGTLWVPRLALGIGAVVCVVLFGLGMFRLVDAAEGRILQQNRDLQVANAVASAIQGRAGTAEIAQASADALLRACQLDAVRIQLNPVGPYGDAPPVAATSSVAGFEADTRPCGADFPLVNGSAVVGRLQLWYPGSDAHARPSPATLASLGTQIASAVQVAQALEDMKRGRNQGHAFYDVLVKISSQSGTLPTLRAIAAHAQRLLGSDAAAIVINVATANGVRFDSDSGAPEGCSDGTSVLGVGLPDHYDEVTGARVNPIGCHHWHAEAERQINTPGGPLGWLWVGRTSGVPFSDRDQGFLATLAELAGVALSSAQLRESTRQAAVLNERTRIARETHDSHAQVLGAVHIRLRSLEMWPTVAAEPAVAQEVSSLADVCAEAYDDAREVILALRESDGPDRGLDETLRSYLSKYTRHYGVRTEFVNHVGDGLALSPRAEVEVVRVVQEALTNVRKHARASRAVVTVTGTDTSATFTIADDGAGFVSTPHAAGGAEGYGLFTMRERLAHVGGTLEVTSAPGQGTRVVAVVPERPWSSVDLKSAAR